MAYKRRQRPTTSTVEVPGVPPVTPATTPLGPMGGTQKEVPGRGAFDPTIRTGMHPGKTQMYAAHAKMKKPPIPTNQNLMNQMMSTESKALSGDKGGIMNMNEEAWKKLLAKFGVFDG